MKLLVKQNATSVLATVFFRDSSSTTGAGLASVAFNSSGITAYYFREGDASSTAISLATMTIGTWATGGLILVDGTNMKGAVQLGLPNACFTALGSVFVCIQGVTNMAPMVLEIQVVAFDPKDAVHLGLSALPNTACTTNASLLTSGTSTDQLSVASGRIDVGKTLGTAVTLDSNNVLNVSAKYLGGTLQTARDIGASVLLSPGTGTGQISLTSGAVTVGTNNDKTGYTLTVTPPTAAAVATAVWQDATAGDFTVSSSIGKSLYTTGNAPGAASGLALVGSAMTLAASQHVIVDSGTVTTLTNLPSIPANWLTAAGINAGALNGKGDWSTYAGGDTSGTTTLLSRIPGIVQPQTGDAFGRLGAPAGASIAADLAEIEIETDAIKAQTDQFVFTVANHVDATATVSASTIWGDTATYGAGSKGAELAAAGGAADPLLNSVPGSYLAGTAGAALGLIGTIYAYVQSIVALFTGGSRPTTSPQPQPLSFAQWEAAAPIVTMSPAQSIVGDTFLLTIRQNGVVALVSSTITVTDSTNGVCAFPLTSAQTGTLMPGIYDYDVWRTTATREAKIVFGQLTVESQQWK